MNKVVKKITAAALSVLMIGGSFAGCSSSSSEGETTTAAADAAAGGQTFNVGICQLVQHDALDAATQGFRDKLDELAAADGNTIEYDYQNASNDPTACATIANQFVSNDLDLIMANATPALQACATATAGTDIPVVATSITDFGVALDIDMAPTDATGINVTGSNDLAPLADQAQQILDLFPDTKTVGCIYCSAEPNSQFQVDGVKEALEAKGIECNFYSFADSNDIQAVVNKAVAESDAIYVPTDNTAASNGGVIQAACTQANVPIIAGEEGIFESTGAVATLSISFYEIGQEAGRMAYEILANGADPATMNIWQPTNVTYYYNAEVAESFGITVPDNYTEYNFTEDE